MSRAPRRWPFSRRTAPDGTEAWTPAAWPGDAATVERWLRAALHSGVEQAAQAGGPQIGGLDGIRITAELTGDDLTHLLIDATGVDLTLQAPERARSLLDLDSSSQPQTPEVVSRTAAMLRSARFAAQPATVQGYPVHLEATVAEVPFDWARYAAESRPGHPASIFGFAATDASAQPSGSFSARVRRDHVAPVIAAIAGPLLATAGVRLRSLTGTITADRHQVVTVRGAASIRWKLFGASVRARASVHISRDAVVTVRRLRLRSLNPLVAFALMMVRAELRRAEGQVIDLNAELAADVSTSIRLRDLLITADDELHLSGRFG